MSSTICNNQGIRWPELVQLMESLGHPDMLITISLPGIEADRSRIVRVHAETNDDGEPGGVLWLGMEEAVADAAAEGVERADRDHDNAGAGDGHCRLYLDVDYDVRKTDSEGLAAALDQLMETALSTPGILDEYGNPEIGEFYAMPDERDPAAKS